MVLVAVGAALLTAVTLGVYAERVVFDSQEFADRATGTLDDESVRTEVGVLVTDQLVDKAPQLVSVRPLVDATVQGAIRTAAFRSLLRDGAETAHARLFGREIDNTVLKVVDVGALVTSALGQIAPSAARKIPGGLDVKLVQFSNATDGAATTDLGQTADDARYWTPIAAVLAVLALIASILLAPDRRRGLARAGFAVTAAGGLVVVAYYVGRAYVAGRANSPEAADAIRSVWGAFFLDLRDWNLFLVVAGLAVAGATRGALPEFRVPEALARAARALVEPPASGRLRALRALVLIALGAVTLADHWAVLTLLAFALGAGLVYTGIAELTRLALPPPLRPEPASEEKDRPRRELRVPVRATALAACVVGLLALGGIALAAAGGDDEPPFEIRKCNGSKALCDRSLAEVVYPSTHNSMSAADQPGWLFANQEDGITAQLDAGVRGLLIDTHYGVQTPRGVYTVLDRDTKSREKLQAAVGPQGLQVAERLRRRIGYRGGGKEEIFFCMRSASSARRRDPSS